jgi:hypothetical protein
MQTNAHFAHPSKYDPSVVACILEFWDMDVQVMSQMLVSFGMNARSMFTSVCNGITTQIKHDMDPSFF